MPSDQQMEIQLQLQLPRSFGFICRCCFVYAFVVCVCIVVIVSHVVMWPFFFLHPLVTPTYADAPLIPSLSLVPSTISCSILNFICERDLRFAVGFPFAVAFHCYLLSCLHMHFSSIDFSFRLFPRGTQILCDCRY